MLHLEELPDGYLAGTLSDAELTLQRAALSLASRAYGYILNTTDMIVQIRHVESL